MEKIQLSKRIEKLLWKDRFGLGYLNWDLINCELSCALKEN